MINKRSRWKFSKVAVMCLLGAVAMFTVAMIILYLRTGGIPDTLVTAFFAFAGGEAGCLGIIKFSDNKYNDTPSSSNENNNPAAG